MSRNEVKSLNDLAMAHGGQLTINPQTGLPEAGFLSSLLPMVAGAALTGLSGGAINPLTAGMIVGGGSYLMNPKGGLMGGLMAGLGAYGGAGLAGGLGSLATSEAGTTTANAATQAAEEAEKQAVSARNLEMANQQVGQKATENSFLGRTDLTRAQMENALMPQNQLQSLTEAQLQPIRDNAMMQSMAQAAPAPTGLDAMYQGAKSVFDDPSKLKDVGGGSYMGLAKMGLAAAAPAAPAVLKPSSLNMPGSATAGKQIVPHYGFTPGMVTPTPAASATGVENTYFQPKYTALTNEQAQQMYPGYPDYTKPAANGGIMGYAAGGPVEQMSNNAAIGANTMYPMANMATSAFAVPYQDPRSTNMMAAMNPSGGGAVDAMSGEPNMQGTRLAAGGPARTDTPYAPGYSGYSGYDGGNNTSNSPGENNGSPTGSTIGDAGYAISNQSFSPLAAAIAQAAMDAMSSTSNVSVNATNGMDVQSDQATATGASSAAGVDGPAGASSNGMGSDTAGDSSGPGEARGGLSPRFNYHMATGGISDAGYNLGGYSDGGRLLRGPGDGVSDSIPAMIGKKQPARLADGEFVVPARIVSELGNGSTEAGARKLYAMMDRIQAARGKTVGKGRVAKNSRSEKYLPA